MEVSSMRLLLVAPPDCRVDAYGSDAIGAPLGALADALIRGGHDVTLWAAPESRTHAALRSIAVPANATWSERERYARLHVVAALADTTGYDAVHLYGVKRPDSMAIDCAVPLSRTLLAGRPQAGERVITPSWAMRRALSDMPDAVLLGTVYPGIDIDDCPFSDEQDGYVVFTGPLSHRRGLHAALVAAYRAERTLLVIGPQPADPAAFAAMVEPFTALAAARYLGDLPAAQRRAIVSRAAALLLPVATPVLDYAGIEALGCGTPVITLDGGAARELVVHGESGIVVGRAADLPAAIDQVDLIDRRACRRRAAFCFTADSAAERYASLLQESGADADRAAHPELGALDHGTPVLFPAR
jgi:glycosyltransferase involved in cell wall biosynthesis